MTDFKNLFEQAQMAEAAYANFLAIPDPKDALIAKGFSVSQATTFVSQWSVVHQYTAPPSGITDGTGFSATLFRNNATGEYTFAIRGTEAGPLNGGLAGYADLLGADLGDIVFDGLTLDQIVDMYNYWKSLNSIGSVKKLTDGSVLQGWLLTVKRVVVASLFPLLAFAGPQSDRVDYGYNYSAVCLFIDFMLAKVPDPLRHKEWQHISSNKSSIGYTYQQDGVTALFEKRDSKIINTKAIFLPETLPNHMRSAKYLSSIFEVPLANVNTRLSIGCDAESVTFNFNGNDLINVEISPEFLD